MATFTGNPAVSADDGFWHAVFSAAGNVNYVGDTGGVSVNLFTRFPNVTVPQGATITSAIWRVHSTGGSAGVPVTTIQAIDNDNAAAPTTVVGANAASLTTAAVGWTMSLDELEVESPNIASVIQEVVDRAGWSSGNAIVLYAKNNGSTTDHLHELDGVGQGTVSSLTIQYTPLPTGHKNMSLLGVG